MNAKLISVRTGALPRTDALRLLHSKGFWAAAPVLLLGFLFTIQAVLITLAVNDPSFAVEEHYYQKAVDWDAARAAQARSEDLGWSSEFKVRGGKAAELTLALSDRSGQAVSLAQAQAEFFFNARAASKATVRLEETAPGNYRASTSLATPGLWIFRLSAVRGSEQFTKEERVDVP